MIVWDHHNQMIRETEYMMNKTTHIVKALNHKSAVAIMENGRSVLGEIVFNAKGMYIIIDKKNSSRSMDTSMDAVHLVDAKGRRNPKVTRLIMIDCFGPKSDASFESSVIWDTHMYQNAGYHKKMKDGEVKFIPDERLVEMASKRSHKSRSTTKARGKNHMTSSTAVQEMRAALSM